MITLFGVTLNGVPQLGTLVSDPARKQPGPESSSCSVPPPELGSDQQNIHLSDHCPLRLSQGSETVLRRRLCRSLSIGYGFNHPCHGRGRGFESRRPRHSFHGVEGMAPKCLPTILPTLLSLLHPCGSDPRRSGTVPTRSPSSRRLTPCPSETTKPAPSCPGIKGSVGLTGQLSSARCKSVWQTPLESFAFTSLSTIAS